MPIYEFSCHNCGSQFETIQSFSSTTTPICPICESEDVVRQMSKPAIHFKGSGWYITDSKKTDKQSANGESENGTGDKHKNETGEKSKEGSAGESKTEAKSDVTAATDKKSSESKSSTDS